ncbi:MAG: LamG domain-containing protein [Polyangiaceae bacterium]|jgi:hypothetical protein
MRKRRGGHVFLCAASIWFAALCECSLDFDELTSGGPLGADATAAASNAPGDSASETDVDIDSAPSASAVDAPVGADSEAAPPSDAARDLDLDALDGTVGSDDTGLQAVDDAASSEVTVSATPDGSIDLGLVALYHFDETSGTTAADSSGHGYTATMEGGATFSPGVRGFAATLDGMSQYVSLPAGIVSALSSFSISVWVYVSSPGFGDRAFDFGTGTTTYMFVTTGGAPVRYGITVGGAAGEEGLVTDSIPPAASWQHIAVTQAGTTGTLYLNGVQVAQSTTMMLNPSLLGPTTQNWLGRSQYASDSYLYGKIDEFRIYGRTLSAAEVLELYDQEE